MSEADVQWLLMVYSISVQPLLVRYIAKNYKKSSCKIRDVVLLSVVAGLAAFYLDHGPVRLDVVSVVEILKTIVKIGFFSFGAWTTIWKRVFPYKKDPMEGIEILKEYGKSVK